MECRNCLMEVIIIIACAFLFTMWCIYKNRDIKPLSNIKDEDTFDWSVFSTQRDEGSELFLRTPCSTVQMRNLLQNGFSHELSLNSKLNLIYENRRPKLKMFFVPHSHNDAGWINTYQDYYRKKTRKILSNILKYLTANPRFRFIWAEVSFLSLFWDEADDYTRQQLRDLLANGQLEIVTGGWVMNDEANPHYFAMLQQLVEGHQWLYDNLEYKPRNGWSIDAFGHSPTMPYLLKRMGFENLVINRIHYQVKKYFADTNNLEFFWRQMWDLKNTSDLFTLVLPFHYSKGLESLQNVSENPLGIDAYGVMRFLGNYLKYSDAFDSDIILIPLGGDFSYVDDFRTQWFLFKCAEVIDFINKHFSESVDAKFGTLSEYFMARRAMWPREKYNTISGDFFTYSDSYETYWSGFYTSRPFNKRKDRILLHYLRAAEILYVLSWSSERNVLGSDWFTSQESGLFDRLKRARRSVSLFQHHDAITGTSTPWVVQNYSNILDDALNQLKYVIGVSIYFLLHNNLHHSFNEEDGNDMIGDINSIPRIYFLPKQSDMKRVRIFNSLTWRRKEIVSVMINTPNIKVFSSDGSELLSQTEHAVGGSRRRNLYTVSFMVEIRGISINTYYIELVKSNGENTSNFMSEITFLNTLSFAEGRKKRIKTHKYLENFSFSNDFMKLQFNEYGLLRSVSLGNSSSLSLSIDFIVYESVTSGAYIFSPQKSSTLLAHNSSAVRIITGPIYSQVDTYFTSITHSLRIYHPPNDFSWALEIKNLVNLQKINCELAMRISSGIKSGDEFFTDLNGLQMVRRRRLDVLGIPGNYYPMSTAAYIEDREHRLTVISGQPGGFASLQEGQMDIMLDRRTQYDDDKGLFQGILDNKPYVNVISMILERRQTNCEYIHEDHSSGMLSQYGNLLSYSILNPLLLFTSSEETKNNVTHFSALSQGFGNDIHLVKLHTLFIENEPKAGVVLHRLAINKCFPLEERPFHSRNGTINLTSLVQKHFDRRIKRSSLSFTYFREKISVEEEYIGPMDMKAYLMSLPSI